MLTAILSRAHHLCLIHIDRGGTRTVFRLVVVFVIPVKNTHVLTKPVPSHPLKAQRLPAREHLISPTAMDQGSFAASQPGYYATTASGMYIGVNNHAPVRGSFTFDLPTSRAPLMRPTQVLETQPLPPQAAYSSHAPYPPPPPITHHCQAVSGNTYPTSPFSTYQSHSTEANNQCGGCCVIM
ncbi:hypothetical protein PHLGIDRAFT_203257 [Phlebiopsis gigantea 11061_1 CR5-6]|uniref:Uncharacterized protein n=1 Tax=Phlebiopsis gigantea (strain 11061_1 CR5-6) TaxID=745531 RepID=A0A0C3S371_PHLG1|nr:hypothetical protein PHLGIDRAFT_203257 [Phlebiopsis gigantea 11061_1 CR5-6]